MKDISNLTISQYQKLTKQLVLERGFDQENIHEVFTLLVEEVGELAKAIRKHTGQKVDKNSQVHDIEDEAADVFWLLLDVFNRLEIDLGTAFYNKEAKNSKRTWQ
jgi:NTP pyrophosphatase (non-canonical NTP hydrolase)